MGRCFMHRSIKRPRARLSSLFQAKTCSTAKCDLLWLGEDSHGDAHCSFGYIKEVSDTCDENIMNHKNYDSKKSLPRIRAASLDDKRFTTLKPVFHHRPVQHRVWIVQEVATAKDVIVYCGNSSLPLGALYRFFALHKGSLIGLDKNWYNVYITCTPAWNMNTAHLDIHKSSMNLSVFEWWARFRAPEVTDWETRLLPS
jgi:hypothetical protein